MTPCPIPSSLFPIAAADVWRLGPERIEWLRQMVWAGGVRVRRTGRGVVYYLVRP